MRILIATHHLLGYSGSELYTLWLAKSVKQAGHDVYVYSPFIDKLSEDFAALHIPLSSDLHSFNQIQFDVAHVHHNITAQEVRLQFPTVPIVMQIHGCQPLLEQLPQENIFPSALLCVSERIREHLISKGIHPGFLEISRNGVDLDYWQATSFSSQKPKRALLLSARISEDKERVIDASCAALGITLIKIGGRFGMETPESVRQAIHHSDFVITIGRGVLEAVASSRPVLMFDHAGGDGFLSPANFSSVMKVNFSGKIKAANYTVEELTYIINSHYNPQDCEENKQLLAQYFATPVVLSQLFAHYEKALREPVPPLPFETLQRLQRNVELIKETRSYSNLYNQQQLVAFRSGKVYRLWRAWHSVVELFHKR